MARLKNIQDALISRIASQVPALNTKTVRPWTGTVDDFFEEKTRVNNLPFCGVFFDGSEALTEVTDNATTREDYLWTLTVIAKDTRGHAYSNEDALEICDDIRDALIGHRLSGQTLVAPLMLGPITPIDDVPDMLVSAYELEIETWQIKQ